MQRALLRLATGIFAVWYGVTGFCDSAGSEAFKSNSCLIEIIGDSIARGEGLTEHAEDQDPSIAFPALLSEELKLEIHVKGWPGAMAGQIASTYAEKLGEIDSEKVGHPDLIFINLGANHRHHSSREYEKQMHQLLAVVSHSHPDSRIVLLNFFRMRPNRLPSLERLAARFPANMVIVWDVRATLVGYVDYGIHPDKESHRKLTAEVVKRMRDEAWLDEVPIDE